MTTTADTEQRIKAAARDWVLRLSLETPTSDDRARFEAWCAEDPRHTAAYRRFESIWRDTETLQELEPLARIDAGEDRWPRAWIAAFLARPILWGARAGLAAASVLVGVWLVARPVQYATGIGELREIQLSDGSQLTLGARSAVEVQFRDDERRLVLTAGAAFFSVTKDPQRPFIVAVGDKRVRVVGTKFEVRRDDAAVRVAVVEGTVQVSQASTAIAEAQPPSSRTPAETSQQRVLVAGQQLAAAIDGSLPQPTAIGNTEPAAWRHGQLIYIDALLSEVIADANRYSREPITITDERVGNLRASVTYPTDRVNEMLAGLSRSLPLEIEHRAGAGILIKPAETHD